MNKTAVLNHKQFPFTMHSTTHVRVSNYPLPQHILPAPQNFAIKEFMSFDNTFNKVYF